MWLSSKLMYIIFNQVYWVTEHLPGKDTHNTQLKMLFVKSGRLHTAAFWDTSTAKTNTVLTT